MTTSVAIILGTIVLVLIVLGGIILDYVKHRGSEDKDKKLVGDKANPKDPEGLAVEDVNHLFNKEFREELRNRGRLRFESIIDENAMFLKQDLDMTIAQVNEYIKKEIGNKLNDEFTAYAKAMKDAQTLAIESLQKSATAVDDQRQMMTEALKKDVADREAALVKAYEENMAKIIEHYLLEALGEQFDLKTQLPFIMSQMEANKDNMVEDMKL